MLAEMLFGDFPPRSVNVRTRDPIRAYLRPIATEGPRRRHRLSSRHLHLNSFAFAFGLLDDEDGDDEANMKKDRAAKHLHTIAMNLLSDPHSSLLADDDQQHPLHFAK